MVRRTNRRRIARGRTYKATRPRTMRTMPTNTSKSWDKSRKNYSFKPWTPNEIKTLRKIFRDMPTKDVAKKLGRSVSSIQGKAGDLGLRKTATYMKKMRTGGF